MDSTIQKVYDSILKYNMIDKNDKILVGLSGGADSVFLCLSLIELRSVIDFEIYAAHLNHGIRGDEALHDEEFVKQFCKENNITLFTQYKDIPLIAKANKISEETAGRDERYSFFRELLVQNKLDKIAVAHNANDNVETVLLNMIRGSALKGLCGIKAVNGNIIRPIINVKRNEIEAFLKNKEQNYCTDSTNLTNIYTRNKIRNIIINTMEEINPSLIDTVNSNLESLINDENFINSYAHKLQCISISNNDIIINRNIFDMENISVKKRLLLQAFRELKGNCNNITNTHLNILCSDIQTGNTYDMPDSICVIYTADNIIFTKSHEEDIKYYYEYTIGEELKFCLGTKIISSYCDKADFSDKNAIYLNADHIKAQKLIIRSRLDGDVFIPYGLKHSKKIKQFMIDLKIPVNDKNKIPIILDGDEIAAILPYRISDKYKIDAATKNILKIQMIKE